MARLKVKPTQRTRGQHAKKRRRVRSPSLGRRAGTAARPGEMARAERRARGKKPVRRPVRA